MTAAVNTIWTKNPSPIVAPNYAHTHIERAPDAGGAPGAFAEIANIAIDTGDEFTAYVDLLGDSASWYKYRWSDVTDTVFSGYQEDNVQPGTNRVKTWVKRNIPDAKILDPYWDQWIEESLIALMAYGIWKPGYADIVPTSASGVVNTYYSIAGKIRDVTRVEALSTSTGNPVITELIAGEWRQLDRQIYIPSAGTSYVYRVWGKTQYSAVGEMTDDYFEMLHEMLRVKYFDFRANGRGNYRAYIVLDRLSDITPEQLQRFGAIAEARVQKYAAALAREEPAILVSDAGYPGYS